MADPVPATALQMRSLVTPHQTVELSLASVEVPVPGPTEVLIQVEAAPINPSDLGILLARANVLEATVAGPLDSPVVTIPLSEAAMRLMAGRVGISMPIGNEGAGTVVAAGAAPAAHALLGKAVAAVGGGMYAQYRCIDAAFCLELPAGTPAVDGASAFVNPLTALGMVETMRREKHVALVHTAAASNLGQMLNRLCISEQIPLVNVVRRPEHEDILRSAGAAYVCNSAAPDFKVDLTAALTETSATLAFDAIGGGRLAGQILACMEAAAGAGGSYSQYGSGVHKQVYIYGSLDPAPTELTRNFGFGWGVSGWLLTTFLQQIGLERMAGLRDRVAAELMSTFASTYSGEVSLAEALTLDAITTYARMATGQKYLIRPNL
jgi:NADPH:quinone reductase-like Zn-dependent oxidoreductase